MLKVPSYFTLFASVLFLLNLLVMNDYASLWDGAESFLAWRALHGLPGFTLHEQVLALPLSAGEPPIDHFALRLPSVAVLLLSLLIAYFLLRPLLGKQLLGNTFLLLASSLLVTNLAKVAAGDIWAFALQAASFSALLRYLKQPNLQWQIVFYLVFPLALWVQPAGSSLLVFLASAYYYFAHPSGRVLLKLNPWAMGILVLAALYFLQWIDFSQHSFYIGFRTGRFLGANLLGVMPFLGLALAGVWESFRRSRQGEELSVVLFGAVLAGLVAHAAVWQAVLALVAAKQLKSYFVPNYPYRSIVLAGAIVQIVAAACFLIVLMMGSFLQFEGAGFRSALLAGGMYWVLSFLGAIGLLGNREGYAKAGVTFSGILLTTFFWLRLYPLVEGQRIWATDMPKEAIEQPLVSRNTYCAVLPPKDAPFLALSAYAKARFPNTVILDRPGQLQDAVADQPDALFFLPVPISEKLPEAPIDTVRYKGWTSRLQQVEYTRILPAGQ